MPRSSDVSITIRELEAFRALMLAGTAVGAAELLGITQPAISRLIIRLESDLGFPLFDRARGRLVPTTEAWLLSEEVDRTFVSVDRVFEVATEIGRANAGRISIACLPALALEFLPRAIAKFRELHPRVTVSLTVQSSVKVEEIAASQQIDFGIAEYPFKRNGIDVDDLCHAPLVLAVPKSHRLASRARARPKDVEGEKFISYVRQNAGRHLVDQVFQQSNTSRQMFLEAQYSASIATLVEAGQGVGLIDPFTAWDCRHRDVKCIPFEPSVIFKVGILYPSHRPPSRTARAFLRLVKKMADDVIAGRAS
jgi:DNA-binding transcriptional LysR family regulator